METNLCPKCKEERPWKDFCHLIKMCRTCRSALASKRQQNRFKKRPWEKVGVRINLLNKPEETDRRLRKREIQRKAWLRRISQAFKKEKHRQYLEGHPCVDCGESDTLVLEFDHLDRTQKEANIAVLLQDRKISWEEMLQEIRKCEVRCVNCHRRRTARQFHWQRLGDRVLDNWQVSLTGKRHLYRINKFRSQVLPLIWKPLR